MGHMVSVYEGEPKHFGSVQAVMYKKDGTMVGGADERRDGKALGEIILICFFMKYIGYISFIF